MIEIELNKVKSLLEQTAIINQKHKDIARITGADYNIFSVLRIHRKEVTLHSRMINDLLNPKGKHAQGDIFLELFLEMIKSKFSNEIIKEDESKIDLNYVGNNNDFSNKLLLDSFTKNNFIKVKDEEPYGIINKEDETGGSIDVFLKSKNETHLIIENKINAKDQYRQLIRYSNSVRNSFILYLNKYGTQPEEISIKSAKLAKKKIFLEHKKDFFCISYEKDILNWLEKCKIKISHLPHLRETLSQYIIIIKRITNQNPNEMNKELVELIGKNFKSAKLINNSFDNVKYIKVEELFMNVEKKLFDYFKEKNSWEFVIDDLKSKNSGFTFRKNNWNENIAIRFSGQRLILENWSAFGVVGHIQKVDRKNYLGTFDGINTNRFNKKSDHYILYEKNNKLQGDNLEKLFNEEAFESLSSQLFNDIIMFSEKISNKA